MRIFLLVSFSMIIFYKMAFSENSIGICNGVNFNNISPSSIAFEPGLILKKDTNLVAKILLNIQFKYNKYSGSSPTTDITFLPDISISYAILKRKCSNVYLGIGFSTEFENMVTGYIPIGVEYLISPLFSFYTNMKFGGYYYFNSYQKEIFGGTIGGDIGIIYYL